MKKLNKKDYLNLGIIILPIIIFIIVLYLKGYLYGSEVDWINQYITIPEYFRNLFYKTGEIIPQFAPNLGLGQNIYYFSYYGLLTPFILISYLLPFIPMYIYIPIINILSLFVSIFLFYKWINNKYNSKNAFISTLIFVLNSTFFYHFHRHIMFVNYMPFLLGGLISIDYYLDKKKPLPLILCTFLMIMTSYYFSVPGIITFGIYALYKIMTKRKFNQSNLFKIIMYVSIGILLSGILIIPTLYAITSGRMPSTNPSNYNILQLLSPNTNYEYTFYYSYYSWGITMIYIVSIISGFLSKKKENIFLSIISAIIIFIPIVSYLLNSFMYIDGKCFIPFIPIMILQISRFIDLIYSKKLNTKKIIYIFIPISIIIFFCAFRSKTIYILITDIIVTLLSLIMINKTNKKTIFFIPVIFILITNCILSNKNEKYVSINQIESINNNAYYHLSNNIKDDNIYRIFIEDNIKKNANKIYNINNYLTSIYSSTSNSNYNKFRKNIFQNEIISWDNMIYSNLLFNIYTGSKYIITKEEAPLGYSLVQKENNIGLYKNNDALPIGYASNKIMSLREFNTLAYPYTIDALLNYVIVNKSLDNVYQSNIKKYQSNYTINNMINIESRNENNHYLIEADNNNSLIIDLQKPIKNEVLFIKFKMNKAKEGNACSSNITINGITNALSCTNWKYNNENTTFEYVLSSNKEINRLYISFTKGSYDISNIEIYTMDYNVIKNLNNNIDEIKFEKTNNNILTGKINAKNDGYVKLTIPYESKGFKIYVDNVRVAKTKIDDTFLGFEITKGTHNIKIEYKTPYLKTGKIVSFVGIILTFIVFIYKRIEKKANKLFKKITITSKDIAIKSYKYIKQFIKKNKGYIFLFISLFILDLSLRLFYNNKVNFYGWYKPIPNLFSILWIIFILSIIKNTNKKLGKTIYLITYIFSLVMFVVHAIYFSYFNLFFDYSALQVAGEGTAYIDSVLVNIKYWVIIIAILSVYLTIIGLKKIKQKNKMNFKKIILILLIFTTLKTIFPAFLGKSKSEIEWDDWRNTRSIYETFNDNNKSMMISGMFEYNIRNFYVNYIRDNTKLSENEKEALNENFENITLANQNNYTGIFKGKNLILIQLESIDDFLVKKDIMPTLYNISKKSINFTNHYSFTSGGGSTFNSEFMVNTGYSTAYNYNQSAYAFSRNAYTYSLPNLFKKEGYTVNAFHMNTNEYYSRGVNYKAFGYDSYNGLKDLNIYKNNEFWLDTELINNEKFSNMILNPNTPTVSYIITYSAHMPFTSNKGTCSMLTDETGLTEYECLKLQAKETDDFINLLIKKLTDNNMLDQTVLALFSDHYLYTIENKDLLDKYKETSNNLINHTPFMIYNNGNIVKGVKDVNSQLDILPTILNLFGIEYYPNNYLGRDILSPNFDPIVYFQDGSWYNGSTYVANGEYHSGKRISQSKLEKYNTLVKKKMLLNDAVIKSDYFNKE